jgi:hypothetical protein
VVSIGPASEDGYPLLGVGQMARYPAKCDRAWKLESTGQSPRITDVCRKITLSGTAADVFYVDILTGETVAAETPPLAEENIPELPEGWRIVYLPPGITRGLIVNTPTLFIGTAPRWGSIVTSTESQASAVWAYADCAFWNVGFMGACWAADGAGIHIPSGGGKVYVGDCLFTQNNMGCMGTGDWFFERVFMHRNGRDQNHDHHAYISGKYHFSRSLLLSPSGRCVTSSGAPTAGSTIDRCVLQSLDGFYGVMDLWPTTAVTNSTIIGTVNLHGGASLHSSGDGNYVDQTNGWSAAARTKFWQPIFAHYYNVANSAPLGAYPFDARLTGYFYLAVTNAVDNGSGLIQLTMTAQSQLNTGHRVYVHGVGGCTEANGVWTVTKIGTGVYDLQDSTFVHAFTTAGICEGWSSQYWAQSMCSVWWNPAIGTPFYGYFPGDDLEDWEAFMNTNPDAAGTLDLQLSLHGGWTNMLAFLTA